ncbi:adenylyl-sulfate kinase [Flavobacterium rhizosphaerae]|uniref:Adenylyl-sulfate kinase n=1 Tax=Flavobacterium rhizosphaerae TaxID=3163298 RepID=A0ABW8YXL6_9FLAO
MKNIIPHSYKIARDNRNQANKHSSFVLWFTGLSGSGKSTIANLVEQELFEKGIKVYALDGDNIRSGINKGLTFTEQDREENLRRIAEIAKLFVDSGTVVVAAFVSPLHKDRELIRNIVGEKDFIEIFVNTSLQECERRDVKGLYRKARAGEIENFTGISAHYEAPQAPFIEIKTEDETVEMAVSRVLKAIQPKLHYSYE